MVSSQPRDADNRDARLFCCRSPGLSCQRAATILWRWRGWRRRTHNYAVPAWRLSTEPGWGEAVWDARREAARLIVWVLCPTGDVTVPTRLPVGTFTRGKGEYLAPFIDLTSAEWMTETGGWWVSMSFRSILGAKVVKSSLIVMI